MVVQMAINAIWHLPMILFLGFYASLLLNISRQERGVTLHDYDLWGKVKYWYRMIAPAGFIISALLAAVYVIARLTHHFS